MAAVSAPARRISLGTVDIGARERALVGRVLDSGHVSPGPVQMEFEAAVAARQGLKYATFVNSGQSALHLSLEALKRLLDKPTLKVLCPSVTYISTLHAVWNAQCDVVLCDVDSHDYLLDLSRYRGRTPDAIMAVDLFGKAWKPTGMVLPILEDACEAIGAPGTGYGYTVCLSFYASHSITTGVGGMVLTDDPEVDAYVKRLANHGRIKPGDIHTLKDGGYERNRAFIFTDEGWSYKNSDLNAALGLGQLERLDGMLAMRRANGEKLIERLRHHPLRLPDPTRHTFQMFPIMSERRDALTTHLNEWGIETREAMPITTQPVVIQRLGVQHGQYPVGDYVAERGFYIGCHQHLTEADLDYVGEAFDAFFRSR